MKRSIVITALSISIGLPAVSIGAAVVQCGGASAAYEKFSKKIHQVTHLDHKPTPETIRKWKSYNREVLARLSKQMEVMCAEVDRIDGSDLLHGNGSSGIYVGDQLGSWMDSNGTSFYPLDLDEDIQAPLIAAAPYPDYPSFSRPISDSGDTGFYTPGGYFGGGGWYGAPGGNPGSGNPPVTPIYPAPEPSTFALLAIGIAAGIWRTR